MEKQVPLKPELRGRMQPCELQRCHMKSQLNWFSFFYVLFVSEGILFRFYCTAASVKRRVVT